jgi:polysaccharide biosynthesis/export protein
MPGSWGALRLNRIGAVLLLGGLVAGCRVPDAQFRTKRLLAPAAGPLNAVTITNRINPAWLQAPTNFYTLGPGDKLDIQIVGEPASKVSTVVGPDGKVYFSLLPGLDAWGLTVGQVEDRLTQGLTNYFREPPQVSVTLRGVESKEIWILGRVEKPGVYAMSAPMTLLEAISMAGGTMNMSAFISQEASGLSQDLADLRRSFVLRDGRLLPVDFERLLRQGDLSQNIYLEPGDFVYLPAATASEVYVLGAVTQPRPVAYQPGLTVAGAIASAYGTLNGAFMDHVAVVRGSLSQPKIAIVDYRLVIRGEAPDVALQPDDIVYVPFAPYRYLTRYAEMILDTFVSASAINAGSQLVSTTPSFGAGIFIPVGSGIQVIPPTAPPPIH